MFYSNSDIERIKNSATKIHSALLELPGWTKNLMMAMVILSTLNLLSTFGQKIGHAIYYFLH